jgi:hypothetical protein
MPNNSRHRPRLLPLLALLGYLIGLGTIPAAAFAQQPEAITEGDVPTESMSEQEYWAGKLTVIGYRKVPFLGKVAFRTSNHLIATVTRTDTGIALSQKVCAIDFEKVFGAKLHIDPSVPPRMHHSMPTFTLQPDGSYLADYWPSGWDTTDLDQDGRPGVSITVRAPLCGGTVYMSNKARSLVRAVPWHGALAGAIKVEVEQKILGTRGACLYLMAKDHTQWLHGFVAYEPIDGKRECSEMTDFNWPDYESDPPTLPEPLFADGE